MPRTGRSNNRRLRAARVVIATGTIILAWAGFEFNHDTPWAYLNVIVGALLAGLFLVHWVEGLADSACSSFVECDRGLDLLPVGGSRDSYQHVHQPLTWHSGSDLSPNISCKRRPRNERLTSHMPDAPPW